METSMEKKRYATSILPSFLFFCFFSCSSSLVHGITSSSSSLSQNQHITMLNLSRTLSAMSPRSVWNSTSNPNPCLWLGVNCSSPSSPSQVTHISLGGLGLSARGATSTTFFSLLCQLHSLQYLDISVNSFDSLPDSFLSDCSGLAGLKYLNVSSNRLSGRLPDLSGFQELEVVDLSRNLLSESIETQLDALNFLKSLDLSYNMMNGSIPVHLSSNLEELRLSDNSFDGQIHSEVLKLGNLTVLDLSINRIFGVIPDGIEKLSKLETLLLSSNNLSGEIPSKISMIRSLSRFAAHQNQFNGTIPPGITRHLQFLDLSYNQLVGQLPKDLLSYPGLKCVDLTENRLQGPIPGSLSKSLYRLRLGENKLNGSIPPAIGMLSNLTYLELGPNGLDGEIPAQLGSCGNLSLLDLSANKLQGGLPKVLGSLKDLVVLKLQGNSLSGSIPDEIFRLPNLSTLNLGHNSLTGGISPAISGLKKISTLHLDYNNLTGSIPDSIGALGELIELQLSNNQLNGTIPEMPLTLETTLNLSYNQFAGPVPLHLASLDLLEILDLSNNGFTGTVPASFAKMRSLTELLLSNNQLSGTLPVFHKYVNVSISGNNLWRPKNSSTFIPSRRTRKSNVLIIIVVLICSIVGLGLFAALLVYVVSRRYEQVEDDGLEQEGDPPRGINGCFMTSNAIHKSNIDFANAMEAVKHPGNITLKTRFSTYYKAVMPNGTSYSVKRLNWGGKIFQMGNPEKFRKELEVLGRLSNSNVMVPLAYVLTRDCAYLFYETAQKGTVYDLLHKTPENPLDWPSRYNIALGVAQGLTFLHGCTQPVLHIDLSTKSIHLKSLKEPQIGDIELCKVIDPSKSPGSLSTIAGSVGYIPPEYPYTMRVTMASNIYSFGVILLELLTGKPPVSNGLELAKWALSFSARQEGKVGILDSNICTTSPAVYSQMLSVLKVALSCVSPSSKARPNMRNVLRMLFNAK